MNFITFLKLFLEDLLFFAIVFIGPNINHS